LKYQCIRCEGESSSGTICSPRQCPRTFSKRLVSKHNFIDNRWQLLSKDLRSEQKLAL
jgi:hypothetical protein